MLLNRAGVLSAILGAVSTEDIDEALAVVRPSDERNRYSVEAAELYGRVLGAFLHRHRNEPIRNSQGAARLITWYATGDESIYPEEWKKSSYINHLVQRVFGESPVSDDLHGPLVNLVEACAFPTVENSKESLEIIGIVIDKLSASRHAFRSRQIEDARLLLEGILEPAGGREC